MSAKGTAVRCDVDAFIFLQCYWLSMEKGVLGTKPPEAEGWQHTCAEGGSVVDVGGFSEGAVCAADIVMVPADHHRSLGSR